MTVLRSSRLAVSGSTEAKRASKAPERPRP
jgi:hypothetical protein